MKYLIATLLYVTCVPILAKRFIQFNEEPSDLVALRNKPAELRCNITAKGKLVISWLKDGVKLNLTNTTQRTILPHGSLYFNPIRRKKRYSPDTGEYRCVGETIVNGQTFKIQSRKAKLTVATISKSFAIVPQNVTLNEGETAFFECKIKRSHPKATVTWKKVGKNTDLALNPRFVVFPSGILEIHSVLASDAGTYECEVTNKAITTRNPKVKAQLNINTASVAPKPSSYLVKPKNVVTLHNKDVILECIVTGYPKPQVEWYKDGNRITLTQSGHYSKFGSSSLKVSSVQTADGGKYECVMGTDKAEANLQVIVPPQFKVSPRDVKTVANKDVTMQCEATGNPKPKITWYKNGNAEDVQVEHIEMTDKEITIMEVLESDGGMYQCFAENQGGEIMASAQLDIYGGHTTTSPPLMEAPSQPKDVKAIAENSTTIRLFWQAPDKPNGKIKEYTVIIQRQSVTGDMVLVPRMPTTQDTQLIVSNLEPATLYQFNVYALNEHNKRGRLSNAIQEFTSQRKLSALGPPRDVQVLAISSMALKVSWKPPLNNLQVIKNYSIKYRDVDRNTAWRTESSLRHNVVLLKLRPYTAYAVKVTAHTALGPGQTSSEIVGKTKSGKPNGIENVVLVAYQDVLVARWDPPSHPNGNITGYLMILKNENSGVISNSTSKDSDYVFMNVQRSVTYAFRVAAVTEAGRGEFSEWTRKRTPPPDTTEDEVPGKPSNLQVRVVLGIVKISWDPPKESHIVVRGYVLSYGKLTPDDASKVLPNITTSYLLRNLQPETIYIIRVRAKNKMGQGLEALDRVTIPRMKQPNGIYNLQAIPFKRRSMRLSWIDPNSNLRPYVGYTVRFKKDHKTQQLNVTKGTALVVKNLRPGMKYTFQVQRNDERNYIEVSNSTMEEVPSAPKDLTVTISSEISTVKVQWNAPDQPNGKLSSYKICWRREDDLRNYNWTCKVVKSYVLNDHISNIEPKLKYSVKILAKNRAGEGAFSKSFKFYGDSIIPLPNLTPPTKDQSSNGTNNTDDHPDGIFNKNFTKPRGTPTIEDGKRLAGATTEGLSDEERTLWIVIAVIAAVTLVAIVIISIVLCKKRAACGTPTIARKPPADPYKAVANGNSKKKPNKEKNFWIKQDNMELEPCVKTTSEDFVTSTIPRSADEMKPLDSPFQSRKDRNSLEDDEDDPVEQDHREEPPPYRHREDYQPIPVFPAKQNNIHIQKSPFAPQDPDEFPPPPPEGVDEIPDEGPSSDYGSEELVSPKCDTDEPASVKFIPKNSPNGCVSVASDYSYPVNKGVHDIDANNLQNLMKDLDAIMAKEDRV